MKEFGQTCYESFVYFNFDEEEALKSIFETNKNPQRIIELLSLIAGEKILPGETLIIFDEVQECPEALNALKYFKEKANNYHIIAAGSLLGTMLAQPKSYPVGMVNLINLYPLYFDEFLEASDPSHILPHPLIVNSRFTISSSFVNSLSCCSRRFTCVSISSIIPIISSTDCASRRGFLTLGRTVLSGALFCFAGFALHRSYRCLPKAHGFHFSVPQSHAPAVPATSAVF